MSNIFLLRLLFDLIGLGLLMAGLAYWRLDNTAHELIGTGMFALLVLHNVFNRRWYQTLGKTLREPRGLFTVIANLSLLGMMLILLVTSVLLSRMVFSFLPVDGGPTARQLHILAAYWVLLLVGTHLGLHWTKIMNFIRGRLGITKRNDARTAALRVVAAALAAHGVYSSFELGIGSMLIARPSIDFWDFGASTIGFFVHLAAVVGLYAAAVHYGRRRMQRFRRRAAAVAS